MCHVQITVLRARGLRAADVRGSSDPFVVVAQGGRRGTSGAGNAPKDQLTTRGRSSSTLRSKTLNPDWGPPPPPPPSPPPRVGDDDDDEPPPSHPYSGGDDDDHVWRVRVPTAPDGGAAGDEALDAALTVKVFDLDAVRNANCDETRGTRRWGVGRVRE